MFGYRRKRRLGCEQLEGRFAPSSFWVGGGSRSTFKDAQALETAQAEQAASYLAASAVLSQSSSVANVVPITFDQPTAGEAGEADGSQDSDNGGYPSPGFPMNCCPPEGWGPYTFLWAGDFSPVPQPTDDGTGFDGQPADDSGSDDIPSVDPISPETPSEPGNDADPVGAVPSEELPAGGDTVATEDFPLVFDDTGMPDPSNTEEMPRCGNDFEDLGPVYPVGADTGFKDADGSDEIAVDEVPVEYQSDDAANEAQPVDA